MLNKQYAERKEFIGRSLDDIEQGWLTTIEIRYDVNDKEAIFIRINKVNKREDY